MKCPQIAIRDLFWLALVVALGLGWWLDHRRSREGYENLQLQWLTSIPPPYPKEEVLEAENTALRAALDKLQQQATQNVTEQDRNESITDDEAQPAMSAEILSQP